jgi:hypothetical protein
LEARSYPEISGDPYNEYVDFRRRISAVPVALQNAEPWSLFDPAVHEAHYSALRQLYEAAKGSPQ